MNDPQSKLCKRGKKTTNTDGIKCGRGSLRSLEIGDEAAGKEGLTTVGPPQGLEIRMRDIGIEMPMDASFLHLLPGQFWNLMHELFLTQNGVVYLFVILVHV